MFILDFLLITTIALLPSVIWLLFFLKEDVHPESKNMILKVFFFGALSAPAAAFVGIGFQELLLEFNLHEELFLILHIFLGIGLTEELLKYLVVRLKVISHHEFDEPVDAMLYMIISGLGFAALENILIFFSQKILNQPFVEALSLISIRFITATFLHALCSALIGYFLALSICNTKNQLKLISTGLISAAFLHGLYDLAATKIINDSLIIMPNGDVGISDYPMFIFFSIILFAILIGLAIFVNSGFKRLKKIKSICKIK